MLASKKRSETPSCGPLRPIDGLGARASCPRMVEGETPSIPGSLAARHEFSDSLCPRPRATQGRCDPVPDIG